MGSVFEGNPLGIRISNKKALWERDTFGCQDLFFGVAKMAFFFFGVRSTRNALSLTDVFFSDLAAFLCESPSKFEQLCRASVKKISMSSINLNLTKKYSLL